MMFFMAQHYNLKKLAHFFFFLSSVQSMFILAISSNGHQETVSMRIKYTLKYQNWAIIFGI